MNIRTCQTSGKHSIDFVGEKDHTLLYTVADAMGNKVVTFTEEQLDDYQVETPHYAVNQIN